MQPRICSFWYSCNKKTYNKIHTHHKTTSSCLALPSLVVCYSLLLTLWPIGNSWFTDLKDGDFPVRYANVYQRVNWLVFWPVILGSGCGWGWRQAPPKVRRPRPPQRPGDLGRCLTISNRQFPTFAESNYWAHGFFPPILFSGWWEFVVFFKGVQAYLGCSSRHSRFNLGISQWTERYGQLSGLPGGIGLFTLW